ncbi:hypothetical protein HJC23_008604 [Cyclotella cryptica]|uniref:Deacetylase sirtuin-type domain-containing protein n=1 Tax=Cyclotella cryptica TaxID=29204 RepID=A0ABD3Q6Y7_9STRA
MQTISNPTQPPELMAKSTSLHGAQSPGDSGKRSVGCTEDKAENNKEEKAPPPQSRESTNNAGYGTESDYDEIASLAEGLGGVSIHPKPIRSILGNVPQAIKSVADLLSSNKCKNIVVLTGAGVSCNARIPDFRTPGTGLYDNLQKYNLPFPEAVFDLGFYRNNPDPFVQLASELWPGLRHSPTITHSFIALLAKKGMLLRNYTQNIDMLDVLAGVPEDKVIECHGHFRTSSCTNCSSAFDGEECKRIIVEEKRAPACKQCGGFVKPDIVFFGESLPLKYHRLVKQDTKMADLLLVMGTSLMVGPVNMIPEMVRSNCPRILLNRELVGTFLRRNGPRTRRKSYDTNAHRDIFHSGDCDDSIRTLCALLGWETELDELNASTRLG